MDSKRCTRLKTSVVPRLGSVTGIKTTLCFNFLIYEDSDVCSAYKVN